MKRKKWENLIANYIKNREKNNHTLFSVKVKSKYLLVLLIILLSSIEIPWYANNTVSQYRIIITYI